MCFDSVVFDSVASKSSAVSSLGAEASVGPDLVEVFAESGAGRDGWESYI